MQYTFALLHWVEERPELKFAAIKNILRFKKKVLCRGIFRKKILCRYKLSHLWKESVPY